MYLRRVIAFDCRFRAHSSPIVRATCKAASWKQHQPVCAKRKLAFTTADSRIHGSCSRLRRSECCAEQRRNKVRLYHDVAQAAKMQIRIDVACTVSGPASCGQLEQT